MTTNDLTYIINTQPLTQSLEAFDPFDQRLSNPLNKGDYFFFIHEEKIIHAYFADRKWSCKKA